MIRRGASTIAFVIAFLLCVFLIFSITAGLTFVYEIPFTIAFGWPKYLWRVVPQLNPAPWSVASAGVCLVAVTLGSHAFLSWLYRAWGTQAAQASSPVKHRRWLWKRTLQLIGLVVLTFVSGIAMTGMAHQTGWLIRSPEGLTRGGREVIPAKISTNNLKQVALASWSYQDANTHFPRSHFDSAGRSMQSWQTALLPYLEQGTLHQQIDQAKPWTDPANAKAMATHIRVFMHPGIPNDSVNDHGVSHYAGNIHVVISDTPRTPYTHPPLSPETILVGEVASHFQAWGDPLNAREPRLGTSGQPNGFGGPNGRPAQFAMLDGSVRTFDPKELAELVGKVPE